MKHNKNMFYKILKNGGLFLILIGITFFLIFRKLDFNSVISTISHINALYLLPAIGAMFVFILCESLNTKRNLKALGYETTLLKCITYSATGFFFSSITPSASGGQPMQVYRMCKDNIKISHSTLVLFIELVFFQIVSIVYSFIGFFTQYSLLEESLGSIKYVLVTGLMINVAILVVLLLAIFSYSATSKIIDVTMGILKFFGYKKTEGISEKAYSVINEYRECASYIMKNKTIMFKTFITTGIQIFALHSVPYWVYRSFGLSGHSMFVFIGIQAVLFIAVSSLPLPGAVGASESGFLMLYKLLFPVPIINEAMLLSRGISFYLFLLLSGLFLVVIWIIKSKDNNKKEHAPVEKLVNKKTDTHKVPVKMTC